MATKFFRATFTGRAPFHSFSVPGLPMSVIVGRQGVKLDGDAAAALKAALKAGKIEGVTEADVTIEEIGGAPKPADAAREALAAEVETLTADRDALAAERDELATKVETLTAAAAETDAAKLASAILESLTVAELKKLAKTRKVDVAADAKEADLINAIVTAATP